MEGTGFHFSCITTKNHTVIISVVIHLQHLGIFIIYSFNKNSYPCFYDSIAITMKLSPK